VTLNLARSVSCEESTVSPRTGLLFTLPGPIISLESVKLYRIVCWLIQRNSPTSTFIMDYPDRYVSSVIYNLKVTASHVHCKCGNISETVPDRVVITCYYRPLIGSDVWPIEQRQLRWPWVIFKVIPQCKPFKFDFSYSCAAVDKILTDSASRGPSAASELLVFWLYSSTSLPI